MNDLLTIKEFAEKVGLKSQGIYKQATNESSRLYPYVVLQKGKRYIRKEALFEVYQIVQPNQPTEPTESTPIQPADNRTNQPSQPADNPNSTPNPYEEIIKMLRQELEDKREEIKQRDKVIEDLRTTKDREIAELHAIMYQINKNYESDKALLTAYQEKEKQEQAIEHSEIVEEHPQEVQEPKKKRNRFMRWLFGEE